MSVARLQYSEALEAPFIAVLAPSANRPNESEIPPGRRRLSALAALARLEETVDAGHDESLGLKAARHTYFGQVGTLDYLVATSATVRDAFQTLADYMPLVTDTLKVTQFVENGRVTICFTRTCAAVRAAWDFPIGGIYWAHRSSLFSEIRDLECWLPYARPEDTSEHAATFGKIPVHFSALIAGYTFPEACLGRPLPRADPRLYAILERHSKRVLASMDLTSTVADRVLTVIEEVRDGHLPSVESVASRLAVSPRTLGRRLEQEGTTYSDLITEWRRRQAQRYLSQADPEIASISARLGYSHPVGFHRAFKRWTGTTPLAYHRVLARLRIRLPGIGERTATRS